MQHLVTLRHWMQIVTYDHEITLPDLLLPFRFYCKKLCKLQNKPEGGGVRGNLGSPYILVFLYIIMETFYLIVLVIATIVLIFILTSVGLLMQTGKKNVVYPPLPNTCPDNWTVDGSNCQLNTSNKGRLSTGNLKLPNGFSRTVNLFNPADPKWTTGGKTAICAQKVWANNNNILWDGVSNYNSC